MLLFMFESIDKTGSELSSYISVAVNRNRNIWGLVWDYWDNAGVRFGQIGFSYYYVCYMQWLFGVQRHQGVLILRI